jgi:hypothetical protein
VLLPPALKQYSLPELHVAGAHEKSTPPPPSATQLASPPLLASVVVASEVVPLSCCWPASGVDVASFFVDASFGVAASPSLPVPVSLAQAKMNITLEKKQNR